MNEIQMTPLTPEQLEGIKQRCERASPAPWWNESGVIHCKDENWTEACHSCDHPVKAEKDEDADFVAHARTDIPLLLAHI